MVGAFWPCEKVRWAIGDNLLIWKSDIAMQLCKLCRPLLTDRTLQEPPTYDLHT